MGAPVIFQRGSTQTQSTHTDRAGRERAFALLLATLSQRLHEPQSRCLKILKANAAYLSRVERYRNQPQGRAQLQKHVARFKFAQQAELSRLDAEGQRPVFTPVLLSMAQMFLQTMSRQTRSNMRCCKKRPVIYSRGISRRPSARSVIAVEPNCCLNHSNLPSFLRRLNSSKLSLLTFTGLPLGFGRRVQSSLIGRDAWFPVGPALMAISNRTPNLPLLNLSVGDANRIQLWPLIEPNRQTDQSVEEAAREVTQQLSSPLQWLMQR